jgi:hypothetical protein
MLEAKKLKLYEFKALAYGQCLKGKSLNEKTVRAKSLKGTG